MQPDPAFSLALGKVQWFQLSYELPGPREALFPPGLHPTTPVIVTCQVWRGSGGDLGTFGLAQTRLSCRAGVRIRAFLLHSVIDGDVAGDVLGTRFGFHADAGRVQLHRRADRIDATVHADGREVLRGSLLDPQVLDPSALQHIGNMHLVTTAQGPKLLQVETDFSTLGLQRGTQRLDAFDAAFWGLPGRTLRHAVSGAFADLEAALPAIRFVQDPERIATVGTVKLEAA
ncbi:MAG TPA: hypothetical protein VJM11_03160 [Nevskiaceae bacterium]|nr:hypothetical protein [Nevskiaceae bacterium]